MGGRADIWEREREKKKEKKIIKEEEGAGQQRGTRLKEMEGGKFDFFYSYFFWRAVLYTSENFIITFKKVYKKIYVLGMEGKFLTCKTSHVKKIKGEKKNLKFFEIFWRGNLARQKINF